MESESARMSSAAEARFRIDAPNSRPRIVKVVHSGRQDMEVLLRYFGQLPRNLCDTQMAAGLAGHAEQCGYASLVERLFGHRLPKTHTRTDWSRVV